MIKNLAISFSEQTKRFYLIYFLTLFFSLGFVASFNIIIDPYQYFFSPHITGINQIKPEYEKNVMLSKAAEASQIKAKTILLGSSRILSGLDSSYPLFEDPNTVYNLGLPGTNVYQSLRYFQHALLFQKNIERVVIGIDFFMFNENLKNLDNFDETRLQKRFLINDLINTSLSIDALQASFITLKANQNPNFEINSSESTSRKFQRWLTNFLEFPGFYQTYNLSQQQLNNFQKIIELCRANNLEYYVFISPTHATQYEAIDRAGLWSIFEEWKQEVVKITPVWDFSGYNSITTEVISESMVNYIDNSHYSQHTGNLVLNRMFAHNTEIVPADFGILIDQNNLASHLEQIKLNRKQWRKERVSEVQLVKKIKNNLDRQK